MQEIAHGHTRAKSEQPQAKLTSWEIATHKYYDQDGVDDGDDGGDDDDNDGGQW